MLSVHNHYRKVYAGLEPVVETPPNFESRRLRTFNHAMPEEFDVD